MTDWNFLLDETALAAVFPLEYGRFVRPIREGLAVFLEGLPAAAQVEIRSRQAELSPLASFSARLTCLARCCPTLHKLGQVLARDQRLAPELRQHLRGLESLAPTLPEAEIHQLLENELGPLQRHGIQLGPAIAEASVAVVVSFVDSHVVNGDGYHHGVLKMLKPGIEDRLELELHLLTRVGAHLDQQCHELRIPPMEYEDIFEQIRDKLRHEVQLYREQRHLCDAHAAFADEPRVQIPMLLERHCTARVTAMQRVTGGKVTDHALTGHDEKRRLAELVIRALVAHPIFSGSAQAMFHGDPHAGNLFLTDDRRLAILDWSLVGSLLESHRVAIVQLMMGAITLDAPQIACVLESLSEQTIQNRASLANVVQKSLRELRHGTLPGLNWLIDLLDDAVHVAGLRPAADLLLFRKSLHTLEGVVADMDDGVSLDDVLLPDFFAHMALEFPRRFITLPHAHSFVTRLSNLDLTHAVFSFPWAITRFWLGQNSELLDVCWKGGRL